MSDLKERLARLSPEQRKLFLAKLKQKQQVPSKITPILLNQADYPVSDGQRRLWYLSQLDPASQTTYLISLNLRLSGQLDVPTLQNSLNKLVQQQQALRTRIVLVQDEPRQKIIPIPSVTIHEANLFGATEEQISAWQKVILSQPLDIMSDVLFRIHLAKIRDEAYALIILVHHAVFDGVSAGIFLDSLITLYNAETEGGTNIPKLTHSYLDFTHWQTNHPQNKKQLAYWTNKLSGELPIFRVAGRFFSPNQTNIYR